MQEIGIESSVLKNILDEKKLYEGRLGKPKFLKLRAGDGLSLREDIWKDGRLVRSFPGQATVRIKQVLYFESFEEMFEALDYTLFVPSAKNTVDALTAYRQFYTPEEEAEYGVVAFAIELV